MIKSKKTNSKRAHTKKQSFLGTLSSKRAQMEMIGLVVIVILITLGMLFMAQFALNDDSGKKVFTRKGLAYSTMSAIMKTSISSEEQCFSNDYLGEINIKIGKDIIDDCVNYYDTPSYSLYNCRGKHSCDFLKWQIEMMLNETLGQWNKNYEFSSRLIIQGADPIYLFGEESPTIKVGDGCPKYKDRDTSGLFPINTDSGLVENILYLCD